MRIVNAIKADVKFQVKQGFYAVYIIITLIYMLIIYQLPEQMGKMLVPLIIYFDPSIVGFFFIGGIVMLEKSQGVLDYLVVTPLRSKEYLMAKAISLTVLAIVASSVIALVTYKEAVHWPLLILGIGMSSLLFTLYGFFVAAKCKSVNEYFVKMIPYMFLIVLPCFLMFIESPYSWIFNIFPSVAGLKVVYGAFIGIHWVEAVLNLIYLLLVTILCLHSVDTKIFGGGFGE
jgi:fluoroquinolone transport system permease protein